MQTRISFGKEVVIGHTIVSSAKSSQTGTQYTSSAALLVHHNIRNIAIVGRRDEVVCGGPKEPVF